MIKVEQKGTEVVIKLDVPTSKNTWTITFERNACNEFHAQLEVDAINEALRRQHRKALREFAEGLWKYLRPNKDRWRSSLGKRFTEYMDSFI